MAANAEVAERFREIADLLDLLGERFKPEAYRRAARSLDGLPEDLGAIAARGGLDEIPGIGAALADKIREYLRDGSIAYRDRLVAQVPPGVVALLKLPGLGPKTVRRFWAELGVTGPEELRAAIEAGRLNGLSGFGPRKIALVRAALSEGGDAERLPLWEAYDLGSRLVEALRAAVPVDRIALAGSLRRARESVGDLDLLVTAPAPEAVFDAFATLPGVRSVRLRGPTKETVVFDTGRQVDLRIVPAESWGAALQYFTGSKDHNVRLRSRAQRLGLRVNEYGVFRDDTRVAGATEAEVYGALGLAEIPPELREDRGEIDVAAAGPWPELVTAERLLGDLHVHLPEGAGPAEVEAARASAASVGHRYLGLVLPEGLAAAEIERLRAAAAPAPDRPRVLWVLERPLGVPPPADLPGVDLRYGRPTGPLPPPAEGPGPGSAIVHLALDRTGLGEADPVRADPWIRWAAAHGAALELGPTAARAGLDSTTARAAVARGVPIALSGGTTGQVDPRRLAVAIALARRAGLAPDAVVNTRDPVGPERRSATPARPAGRSGRRPAAPRTR